MVYCSAHVSDNAWTTNIMQFTPKKSKRCREFPPTIRIQCIYESEAPLSVFSAPANPKPRFPRSMHLRIRSRSLHVSANPHSACTASANANPRSRVHCACDCDPHSRHAPQLRTRIPALRVNRNYKRESFSFKYTASTNANHLSSRASCLFVRIPHSSRALRLWMRIPHCSRALRLWMRIPHSLRALRLWMRIPHSSRALRLWMRIPFLRVHCAYEYESPFFACFASISANPPLSTCIAPMNANTPLFVYTAPTNTNRLSSSILHLRMRIAFLRVLRIY